MKETKPTFTITKDGDIEVIPFQEAPMMYNAARVVLDRLYGFWTKGMHVFNERRKGALWPEKVRKNFSIVDGDYSLYDDEPSFHEERDENTQQEKITVEYFHQSSDDTIFPIKIKW